MLISFIRGANSGGLRGLVDILVIVRRGAHPGVIFQFFFFLLSDHLLLLRLLGLGFGVHRISGKNGDLGEDLE